MVNKNHFSFLKDIFSLVLVALFIAVYGVLALLRIYIIPNQLRLSLTFMPVAWSAMLFGPVAGGLTGALGDIVGWTINPMGPFFPGFTFSAFVTGVIYGLFLYKREITWKRVFLASITMVLIVEAGLNTIWLSIMTGSAYKVLIGARIIKSIVLMPVQAFILYTTGYMVKKFIPAGMRRV